jgi:hypothetical protein
MLCRIIAAKPDGLPGFDDRLFQMDKDALLTLDAVINEVRAYLT